MIDLAAGIAALRDARPSVFVAGDVMLDEYVHGEVSRVSPEAPVPVVRVAGTEYRLGGAANAAHNVAALGGRVALAGIIGEDEAGQRIVTMCRGVGIEVTALRSMPSLPTIRKVRVVSQHQQLLRMDWEGQIPREEDAQAAVAALSFAEAPDAIVLSDYGKGFLCPAVVTGLIQEGRRRGIPVLIDPKGADWSSYRGATAVTPNIKELEAVVGRHVAATDLVSAARSTLLRNGVSALVLTLGERGLLVVTEDWDLAIRAVARDVYDVTGAGDTVIAALAVGLATGLPIQTAAALANVAGGIVVGKSGTAVVSLDEIQAATEARGAPSVCTEPMLDTRLRRWRAEGRAVVFTNGCFDVLHAGHLSLLRFAAAQGDVLVVGINDDASVSRLKGAARPVVAQGERVALVSALDCVDAVCLFSEDTPLRLIERVAPDVLVKGADYAVTDVIGRDLVQGRGGRVVLAPLVPDRSTSALLSRLQLGGTP